jgi:hydroxymethylpyrimidine/phosphomethylpyrimidine kinase
VRFGASGHVARYLLAVREYDPERRFACNCRFDDAVEAALAELGWPTVELDRRDQPDSVAAEEGSTMEWAARVAFGGDGDPPVAVYDHGAVGKEPMCRLTARTTDELHDRVLALSGAADRHRSDGAE